MSTFAESFFRDLSECTATPMLLRKGELHRLIPHMPARGLPAEVVAKLDALKILFQQAGPQVEPVDAPY